MLTHDGWLYLLPPLNVVRAAAAAAAAAILFALPSTFCSCVGDSLAANAFSVCNISTGFRDAGQSGRMGATLSSVRRAAVPRTVPVLRTRRGKGATTTAMCDDYYYCYSGHAFCAGGGDADVGVTTTDTFWPIEAKRIALHCFILVLGTQQCP